MEFKHISYVGQKPNKLRNQGRCFGDEANDSFGRTASRFVNVPRRTIQRWLRAKGITVKRCPDWVYSWAYWRRRSVEKRRFWS